MPSRDHLLQSYAALLVRTAVNVQPGQELLVQAELEHAPLVRAVAAQAYRAGARYVDVHYDDRWTHRALLQDGPDESLGWTPAWMVERMDRAVDAGAAAIGIVTDTGAQAYEGIDPQRLARARQAAFDESWVRGIVERRLAWTICAYPSPAWAERVLGAPDVERFWSSFAEALRLDEPDPASAWERRLDDLQDRAASLTERGFRAVRFRGARTDLEVGLIERSKWVAGRALTVTGQQHVPNLPTEEVFTTPHRLRAEGTVAASRPFTLGGTVVDGLTLRISGGRIVEARARSGEAAVQADLSTDDGASRLGEVALVDEDSRVARAGLQFHTMLFDENAGPHLAWGHGLPTVLAQPVSPDQLVEHGLNQSAVHTDVAIGGADLEVDGIEPGGAVVPLLRAGVWQLSG